MEKAIEINDLTKNFGGVIAVDSLNLTVNKGEIYGFLGRNGAGKTTTIRCLLGMIQPAKGKITIFGKAIPPKDPALWKKIGHLVESPSAYPELTVRENLECARRLQYFQDKNSTNRVIDKLGLSPYSDRKAGHLSQGNLQRLALARALLHSPELLILDEPSNGLDPAGVVEIRGLLASLSKNHGTTILMSSHVLTEVDRLADRIGIIYDGKMIEELDAAEMQKIRSRKLIVDARDRVTAAQILEKAGFLVDQVDPVNGLEISSPKAVEYPDEIARLLVNNGCPPTKISVSQQDLEEHFIRITGQKE